MIGWETGWAGRLGGWVNGQMDGLRNYWVDGGGHEQANGWRNEWRR